MEKWGNGEMAEKLSSFHLSVYPFPLLSLLPSSVSPLRMYLRAPVLPRSCLFELRCSSNQQILTSKGSNKLYADR
jgi:hypothetical protein